MAPGLLSDAERGGAEANETAEKYFRKQTGLQTTKQITEGMGDGNGRGKKECRVEER